MDHGQAGTLSDCSQKQVWQRGTAVFPSLCEQFHHVSRSIEVSLEYVDLVKGRVEPASGCNQIGMTSCAEQNLKVEDATVSDHAGRY